MPDVRRIQRDLVWPYLNPVIISLCLVLEELEAGNDEPEAPSLPATMMSKARQNRLHYMQLQDAVDSADLVPVERGAIENGLTRVAKRIPRHLKYSDETHQILTG